MRYISFDNPNKFVFEQLIILNLIYFINIIEDNCLLYILKSSNKISNFLYYKNIKYNLYYCLIAKACCLDYFLNSVSIKLCSIINIKLFFLIVYRDLEFFFLITCRNYKLFFVLYCNNSLNLFFSKLLLCSLLFSIAIVFLTLFCYCNYY